MKVMYSNNFKIDLINEKFENFNVKMKNDEFEHIENGFSIKMAIKSKLNSI